MIGEVFFPIPLENVQYIHHCIGISSITHCQVCIPGLHMSLGIFNRLFNLLERACQDLDLEMAARAAGEGIGGPTYQQHVKALGDLARVKEQQESAQQRATLYGQLATHFLLSISIPGSDQSPLVRQI